MTSLLLLSSCPVDLFPLIYGEFRIKFKMNCRISNELQQVSIISELMRRWFLKVKRDFFYTVLKYLFFSLFDSNRCVRDWHSALRRETREACVFRLSCRPTRVLAIRIKTDLINFLSSLEMIFRGTC